MKFPFRIALAALIAVGAASGASVVGAPQAAPLVVAPSFELDAAWPKVPAKWKLGNVSSVAVDERDHVWIIQRPQGEGVVPADKKSTVAPPVMEFDAEGNLLQAWGGPGNGYEWPQREHGIHLDYDGNVWVGGNYCPQRNLQNGGDIFVRIILQVEERHRCLKVCIQVAQQLNDISRLQASDSR